MGDTNRSIEVPVLEEGALVEAFREALQRADFTEAGACEALRLPSPFAIHQHDIPLYLRVLPGDTPLSTLIRLFLLGCQVGVSEASHALGVTDLGQLERSGLILRDDDQIISPIRLTPWSGLILAHDPESAMHLYADHVSGVTPAARTLASLAIRQPVDAVLDLGCGGGVQALLAAAHATKVVAVDINARALGYAALNARLNGISNLECREGSLFEPAEGLLFDLIVANPPYVISPDYQYVFRDSGQAEDTLCRKVVSEAPMYLREGGTAHVLCNWVHRAGENWWEPVEQWVKGSGCDAVLLHGSTMDPLTYAVTWNSNLRSDNAEAFSLALDRWLNYYEQAEIDALVMGAIVLRRRAGRRNWILRLNADTIANGSASEQILRIFRAQDYMEGHPDGRTLLDEPLALVDRHRVEQTLVYRDGQYTVQNARLVLEEGMGVTAEIGPQILSVLFQLDGQRRLIDLAREAADEAELDPDRLIEDVLVTARQLFERGLVCLR